MVRGLFAGRLHQMHPDNPISPQQAREVAAALIAAADELGAAIQHEWTQR